MANYVLNRRCMMRRSVPVLIFALCGNLLLLACAQRAYGITVGCASGSGSTLDGHTGQGSVGVGAKCDDKDTGIGDPSGTPIVVVDCGTVGKNVAENHWDSRCGASQVCPPVGNQTRPHPFASGFVQAGTFVVVATWCPDGATPTPSLAALRDEVIKLLPKLPVGVSPARGQTLANFRTLFWVDTPQDRTLGRSQLIGFPVELRVHFKEATFDFGDGSSDSASDPGTPYDPKSDCGTCIDRFGHVYEQRGSVTVSATVTWTAEFRVGGGAWLPIPGDVDGATSTDSLVVRESRGVLVAPH
jgi:hypothetical protein